MMRMARTRHEFGGRSCTIQGKAHWSKHSQFWTLLETGTSKYLENIEEGLTI
jgi:hypothetical protein